MRGVFLLCLVSLWAGRGDGTAIKLPPLVRIMRTYGTNGQYAMAVRQPKNICQNGGYYDFLIQASVVRQQLNQQLPIYNGRRMKAAKPYYDTTARRKYHAEYSLLVPRPQISYITDLLNEAADQCVVFYTYYSPCLDRCMSDNDLINIKHYLSVFSNFDNNWKAFVFTKVYDPTLNGNYDQHGKLIIKPSKQDVFESFRIISQYIPIFRCEANVCYDCMENVIDVESNRCLTGY